VFSLAVVVFLFDLQHLQGFRIDLGLEAATLVVCAAQLVATVVDLQPLDLASLTSRHLPHRFA